MPDVFVDTKQSCKIPLNFDIDTSVSGIGWSETHFANDTSLAFAGYTFGKNIQNELANNTKSDIKTLINQLSQIDRNFGLLFKNSRFLVVGLITYVLSQFLSSIQITKSHSSAHHVIFKQKTTYE